MLEERLLIEFSHYYIIQTFCPPNIIIANSLVSRCQSGCQIFVRVVVRELLSVQLLSEWLLSEWLLSEWLLSEWLLSELQSGSSAVKVSDKITPLVSTSHLYSSQSSNKTTMKYPNTDRQSSRANMVTQTQTKSVNPKQRSKTQEPTQKDRKRRPNQVQHRKITY
jgi:hypothetical protein